PIVPTPVPNTPFTTYSYAVINTNTSGTNALSLRDAIVLALEHNLDLQVFRYDPLINEYTRRSLYGVYDPALSARLGRAEAERETGGINLNTGNTQPGTTSETDSLQA